MLWNNKKLKSLREAILLAGGPAVKAIGQFTTFEAVLKEVEVLGQKNLDDYHIPYEVSKDLSDLQKLIRYKCGRSWIPRLSLWLGELKGSLDEQRVHIYERRQIHKDCIRHVLQTCERILFSLADLLTWQETAFMAAWSIEEQCPLPPAAKRFLPNRGDIDDDARTPRDEADAIALAPDDEIEGADSTRGLQAAASFAEDPKDNVGLSQSHAGLGLGASTNLDTTQNFGGGLKLQKLDKTFVRSRGVKDTRKQAQVLEEATVATRQAQAMTQSFAAF